MRKVLFIILGLISPICLAEIVVIAHPSLKADHASRKEIERIYCGSSRALYNGTRLLPIDQKVGAPSREMFYQTVVKKQPFEVKIKRSRQVFSGFTRPLRHYKNDEMVKALIASEPGYIGYVDASSVDSTVKVIYPARLANTQTPAEIAPEIELDLEPDLLSPDSAAEVAPETAPATDSEVVPEA